MRDKTERPISLKKLTLTENIEKSLEKITESLTQITSKLDHISRPLQDVGGYFAHKNGFEKTQEGQFIHDPHIVYLRMLVQRYKPSHFKLLLQQAGINWSAEFYEEIARAVREQNAQNTAWAKESQIMSDESLMTEKMLKDLSEKSKNDAEALARTDKLMALWKN